jgi:hypothetical protein
MNSQTVVNHVASRDFSKKTLRQLAAKNIQLLSALAIPAFEGDACFSGVAYQLAYKENGFIRTHSQVIILANSSWDPETDLEAN